MTTPIALVMAGGTGGHIFPALAVSERLRGQGWQVVWLGTRAGLESRLVPPHGLPIEWLSVAGARGKGLLQTLAAGPRLLLAIWQALRVIRRRHPDVVLGFGGFVALPGGVAAILSGRPLLIHEQNAVAGLTNRLLAQVARTVLQAFPQAFAQRGGNPLGRRLPVPVGTITTGNPVRVAFQQQAAPAERFAGRTGALQLLVLGGSQGARALNQVVPAALALLPSAERPRVLHQAGAKLIDEMRDAYSRLGIEASVVPFIEDVAGALAVADLVICRAGALTVAELAALGVASVLVPFPAAVDDHQTVNAAYLADAGAAELIPQAVLTAEVLAALLATLDRPKLLQMAERARTRALPQATDMVVDQVKRLYAERRGARS